MTQEPINSEEVPLSSEGTLPSPDSVSVVTPIVADQATDSGSLVRPLPLTQAIRALPRQYFRVFTKPSVATVAEEMGKASWNMVWLQLIGLGIITVLLDFLRRLISPWGFVVYRTFALLSLLSPIITIPLTFLITMGIAYGIAKAFAGLGTFLAQTYIALLPFVPLTILGQLLTLLNPFVPRPPVSSHFTSPAVTSTLILFTVVTFVLAAFGFALLIYRVVLQVLGIMAVHRLTGGKAATVIIAPTVVILILTFFSGLLLALALGFLH